jgi:uncharacterized membrane protein YhaH (DUF805 family)
MNWYIKVLKNYAVFEGRAQRAEYWFFQLFNIIATIVLTTIDAMMGSISPEAGVGVLSGLYGLAIIVPNVAVTARRLHDTGRSGWWQLIMLVPLIGLIVLLVFLVMDSKPGDNEYGPNPKGV